MDFVGVLDRVDAFLTERGWRFALVGGVALAVYGNPRLTLDLDIATEGDAQEALVTWMETAGYATLYRSSGFSNHRHASPEWGRNDPTRTLQEMADVGYLLTLAGTNREEAREYFAKAGLLERWEDLIHGI